MKSIEEKAKRYDKAIERAKNYYSTTDSASDIKLIGLIFPELKESEDEKIRKELLNYLYDVHDDDEDRARWLAWLEKQGEHANFRNKIKIGDKVTRNKDGVLVNLSQLKRVAKKDEKQDEQKDILKDAILDDNEDGLIAETIRCKKEKPCEQKSVWSEDDEYCRHQLIVFCENCMQPDSGAIRCANWLKSIKDRIQPQSQSDERYRLLGKLKEWLDEYVSNLADVDTDTLICSFTNYLDGKLPKSLRPQNKQEWVGATKEQIDIIAQHLENIGNTAMAEILYGLRPQNTLKPSDEQVEALEKECIAHSNYELCRLLEQLKKLRED